MSTRKKLNPVSATAGEVVVDPHPLPGARKFNLPEITAYVIIAGLLLFVLFRHLVPGVLAGLTLYLILDQLSLFFSRRMPRRTARPLALISVTLIGGGVVAAAIALLVGFARRHADQVPQLMAKMAEILDSTRAWLGDFGSAIPEVLGDAEQFKAFVVTWLKTHSQGLKLAGGSVSMALVHMIMAMLLAVMVFFRHIRHAEHPDRGPLADYLLQKLARFGETFSKIAIAQIKISAVNTTLTALYLLVLLPLFHEKLPFAMTIVVITFICGLIPILGNLISNAVIVIVSLGVSPGTAIASLAFLVLIHKLEYLINSRIVGGQTDSEAWEILLAILIGETAFGVAGVVMAPIIYAFAKRELREHGLV
jgi:predicted PurR-regulated permease PerM